MSLPPYWRYLDLGAAIGITLAIIGSMVGMYVAYLGLVERSSEEVFLALMCLFLSLIGITATLATSFLSLRAMKLELRR